MRRTVAEIVIDGAIGSFDKKYSYALPKSLVGFVRAGMRVIIPFGKANIKKQGMILSVYEDNGDLALKEVLSVLDKEPILSDEMLKMCEWMHSHIFCSYYDAIHAVLPTGLNYKITEYLSVNTEFSDIEALNDDEKNIYEYLCRNGETDSAKLIADLSVDDAALRSLFERNICFKNCVPKRVAGDLTRKYIRVCDEFSLDAAKLTARQKEVYELLCDVGSVSVRELQYFSGASIGVINSLVLKGAAQFYQKQEFRLPFRASKAPDKTPINLTDEQNEAFLGLKEQAFSDKGETALLFSVTGSGKTQVFLKLTDEVSASGRGVIIMVPEIALTPQMIRIFSDRYGDKIAVFHSAMSIGQRMDEYNRVKSGKALIAIGTRSAVFAPFKDLGLIIIDEEQEHTYKSEKSPRFNARDLARFRSAYHKGLLCLASATPSMESYSAALSGKIKLYKLAHRFGAADLPEVMVVDMHKELNDGNSSNISRALANKIESELSRGKQAIILLNRRGHNTYVSCRECGWVASCDSCSVSLTYHSANKRMMCHYCGKSIPLPSSCPDCDSEFLSFTGAGTQRLEEELNLLFPNAKILRLDADSTLTRDSYSENLGAFSRGEYDIMIGTQMVAKGLDFPRVTVVGVIGADRALYSDDYRGFERTFSLLTQVVGRAGRADDKGIAVIQTTDVQNNVITLAKSQDYDAFYQEEILNRKLMTYPPFCDIALVVAQSVDRNLANDSINQIFNNIKTLVACDYSDVKTIILGPCAATVPRVNGKYRFRMIIKCKNNQRFREMLQKATEIKRKRDTYIGIDINPEALI